MSIHNKKSDIATAASEAGQLSEEDIRRIVDGCKKGNADSLERFFEVYGQDIYNFPMRVFSMTEDDAGDFFLFAFERLRDGRRMRTFLGDSRFRTWLYTVLRNLVIDWLRSRREVELIPVDRIEREESRPSAAAIMESGGADEVSVLLANKLSQIPQLHKIIFKLVYLYYVDLDADEVNYLEREYAKPPTDTMAFVLREREDLASKEEENLRKEDSLTHLYLTIHRLREKKDRLRDDRSREPDIIQAETEKLDTSLEKKYATRNKILERKRKGLLVARVPYRVVAGFLGIPEGSVSVYMGKVASFLTNDPDVRKIL